MIILRPSEWAEMAISHTMASPWILKKNASDMAFLEEQCGVVKLQGLISAQGMLQSKNFGRPFLAEMSQRIFFDFVWTTVTPPRRTELFRQLFLRLAQFRLSPYLSCGSVPQMKILLLFLLINYLQI